MHNTIDTSTEAEEVQLALMRAMSGHDGKSLSDAIRSQAADTVGVRDLLDRLFNQT